MNVCCSRCGNGTAKKNPDLTQVHSFNSFWKLSIKKTGIISGGSRISRTMVPTQKAGVPTYYLGHFFPKNYRKLKGIGSRGVSRPLPLVQRRVTLCLKISIFLRQYFINLQNLKAPQKNSWNWELSAENGGNVVLCFGGPRCRVFKRLLPFTLHNELSQIVAKNATTMIVRCLPRTNKSSSQNNTIFCIWCFEWNWCEIQLFRCCSIIALVLFQEPPLFDWLTTRTHFWTYMNVGVFPDDKIYLSL